MEMRGIVAEAVEPYRGNGLAQAWHSAARFLGISPRRVRGYLNGEVRSVTAWEADQLRKAKAALREAKIKRLEHELAVLRAAQEAR
jgi:hypothetical protein